MQILSEVLDAGKLSTSVAAQGVVGEQAPSEVADGATDWNSLEPHVVRLLHTRFEVVDGAVTWYCDREHIAIESQLRSDVAVGASSSYSV